MQKPVIFFWFEYENVFVTQICGKYAQIQP